MEILFLGQEIVYKVWDVILVYNLCLIDTVGAGLQLFSI